MCWFCPETWRLGGRVVGSAHQNACAAPIFFEEWLHPIISSETCFWSTACVCVRACPGALGQASQRSAYRTAQIYAQEEGLHERLTFLVNICEEMGV
jgi:hypothetical protein